MVASNWFAASLLAALAALGGALETGRASFWFLAGAFLMLTVPISATFARKPESGRLWMAAYTIGLTALACAAGGVCFFQGTRAADNLFTAFLYGFIGFLWIANFSGARREYQ